MLHRAKEVRASRGGEGPPDVALWVKGLDIKRVEPLEGRAPEHRGRGGQRRSNELSISFGSSIGVDSSNVGRKTFVGST
jgi:hypothetical protein